MAAATTNRDPMTVKVGEKFEISMEENPSTGYVWLLLDQELEFHGLKGIIKLSDSRYEPAKSQEDAPILVGAPGTRTMELEALTAGKGTVHMILGRPWEVQKSFEMGEVYQPVQDIKFEVTVNDA